MPLNEYEKELITAARTGNTQEANDAIVLIQQYRAGNINTVDEDNGGNNALHLAIKGGHIDIVRLLLDNRADPNLGNGCGQTPLHLVAYCNVASVGVLLANLLLEYSADIEAKTTADDVWPTRSNNTFLGGTPLHFAVIFERYDLISYLIKEGANPETLNHHNLTPIEVAMYVAELNNNPSTTFDEIYIRNYIKKYTPLTFPNRTTSHDRVNLIVNASRENELCELACHIEKCCQKSRWEHVEAKSKQEQLLLQLQQQVQRLENQAPSIQKPLLNKLFQAPSAIALLVLAYAIKDIDKSDKPVSLDIFIAFMLMLSTFVLIKKTVRVATTIGNHTGQFFERVGKGAEKHGPNLARADMHPGAAQGNLNVREGAVQVQGNIQPGGVQARLAIM